MRRFAVSAGLLLAVCGCLVVVPARALAAAPSLVASPDRGTLAASPLISGSCPGIDTKAGPVFPPETVLSLDGSGSGPWKVPLAADGTFTGFVADLTAGATPGSYSFSTRCGGSAPFVVLAAPTVRLDPVRASEGETVLATGSCPRRPRGVTPAPGVFLDRRFLGTAPLDAVTGQFGAFSVEVPIGAAPGDHQVSTSCGGRATVTVLAPVVVAPSPRGVVLVVVPDLRGRTEQEAVAVLAGRLVLAGGGSGSGRIRSQDPLPGTRVRPGSAVQVVVEAAVQPASTGTALPPLIVALIALLLVLLAAAFTISRGRRRRQRRWLDGHLAVWPGGSHMHLSDVPHQEVPGLEVQLVVHRGGSPRVADQGVSDAGR
jgi:hypothetical protein